MLFFFDIDGTLQAEDDGSIQQSTIDAIATLRRRGHKTFINTGRPRMNVLENITFMGFDGFVYGCGTEIVLDGNTLFRNIVDKDVCTHLAEEILACNAAPLYERSDALFLDNRSRILPQMKSLLDLYRSQGLPMSYMQERDDFSYDKFVIWYDEETDLNRFKEVIKGHFRFVDRGYGFAEMVPEGCGKADGITLITEMLGFDKSETVAFGDSLNDADMLHAAGLGIAMGGAELLAPHADYVTDEIKKDGIAKALQKYRFI